MHVFVIYFFDVRDTYSLIHHSPRLWPWVYDTELAYIFKQYPVKDCVGVKDSVLC